MLIYITKYALTRGIIKAETSDISSDGVARVGFSLFVKNDYCTDEKSAQKRAGEIRKKKIKSINKMLEKFTTMGEFPIIEWDED